MMTISVRPSTRTPGKWAVYVADGYDGSGDSTGEFLFAESKHGFACDSAAERLAGGCRPEDVFDDPTDPDVTASCERFRTCSINTLVGYKDNRVVVEHHPELRKK